MTACLHNADSGRDAAGRRKRLCVCALLQIIICALPVGMGWADGEQGRFMVTGHILNKWIEVGVTEGFLEFAVPYINRSAPDFLVLTGDEVLGGRQGDHRFPVETITRQYAYLKEEVLGRINPPVYCVAGNHDTGHVPHAPSVELFETLLNPLQFSFEHKGSLFLFLSPYQPFPHVPVSKDIPPFGTIWESYDTPASRAFLDFLRRSLSGRHSHIFVFISASPVSDVPLGYYWSHFVIPLLASLPQDVHVFSTDQFTRDLENRDVCQVVRCNNIRFYPFAVFPRGSYAVSFNRNQVNITMMKGTGFAPVALREIACRPASRLSMLRRYLVRRIGYPLWGAYSYGIYYIKQALLKLRGMVTQKRSAWVFAEHRV